MRYIFFATIVFLFVGCAQRNISVMNDEDNAISYNTQKASKVKKLQAYKVLGRWYYPKYVNVGQTFRGISSWYGPNFHGKLTANGETYNMYGYTAANKIMPMNTIIKVINLNNNKSVVVRVNDRGPFMKGRILDLSYMAGKKIGLDKTGTAPVEIEVLKISGSLSSKTKYKVGKHKKNGKIKIQIGAFRHLSGAKIFKEEFGHYNKRTYIQKRDYKYKVFIGNFSSYNEAKKFKIKYNIKGFVVK